MQLNAVYGHWEANSYALIAEADDYFSLHPESASWDYHDDTNKGGYLVHATRWLDQVPDFVIGGRLFSALPRKQLLRHPTDGETVISGTATGGGSSYLVDSGLANQESYRSNEFRYGTLEITGGTGIYGRARITNFDVDTGIVTVPDDTFSTPIDATSEYSIVYPLVQNLKAAVFELALYISAGNFDQALNAAQMEQGAVTPLTVLPLNVQHLIGLTVAWRPEVRRA